MSNEKNDKAERLAAALRENLKRRKAQSRSAAETPPKDDVPEEAPPRDRAPSE
ncbi:hypothetical protein ACFOKI_00480 [Sphingomonas qilianensis]|uniref:Uncharacterized protein n=1 Tax=Sphingomonas qilianensis TaxID=1736690 RepID=A0ABU9XVX9_9SPHN